MIDLGITNRLLQKELKDDTQIYKIDRHQARDYLKGKYGENSLNVTLFDIG